MTTRSTDSANILLHHLQIHTHSEYFTVYTMIRNSDEVLEKLCKYVCKKKYFLKRQIGSILAFTTKDCLRL